MDTTTTNNSNNAIENDPLKVVEAFPNECKFTSRRASDVVNRRSEKRYGTQCHLVIEMEGKFPYANRVDAPFSMTGQDDDALAMRVRAHTNGVPVSVDIRGGWGAFQVTITWFVAATGPSRIKTADMAWVDVCCAVDRPMGVTLEALCETLIRDLFHAKAREFRGKHVVEQSGQIINTLVEVCDKRARTAMRYSERLQALNNELATSRGTFVGEVLREATEEMVDKNFDKDIIAAVVSGLAAKVGSGPTAPTFILPPSIPKVEAPAPNPYNPENVKVGDRVVKYFEGDNKSSVGTVRVVSIGCSDDKSLENVFVTVAWDDDPADLETYDVREVSVVWRGDGSAEA